MKYIVDNDLHIHSKFSSCSNDEAQTTERMLQYAKENGLKTICVTDHFWDEKVPGASAWYSPQNHENLSKSLPLPKDEDLIRLFKKAASVGVGIEPNSSDMDFADEDADIILRPLKMAKECGCKFYLGSDARHPDKFKRSKQIFERAVDLLELEENYKFRI